MINIDIQTSLVERKWMRAAKAWRCFFALPCDPILAASLTALIEQQVCVKIAHTSRTLTIDPAFIVDVPNKGKKFHLVIETVYESQNGNAPYLTEIIGQSVSLSILPLGTDPAPAPPPEPEKLQGVIGTKELTGLHHAFFKNRLFWEFLQEKTGVGIHDEHTCKQAYKDAMGVESCRFILTGAYAEILSTFNAWLKARRDR